MSLEFNRLRHLPKKERKPFKKWLGAQTRPLMDDEPMDAKSQDAYYQHDYESWKRRGGVFD